MMSDLMDWSAEVEWPLRAVDVAPGMDPADAQSFVWARERDLQTSYAVTPMVQYATVRAQPWPDREPTSWDHFRRNYAEDFTTRTISWTLGIIGMALLALIVHTVLS